MGAFRPLVGARKRLARTAELAELFEKTEQTIAAQLAELGESSGARGLGQVVLARGLGVHFDVHFAIGRLARGPGVLARIA